MKSDARYFNDEDEPITAVEDHHLRMDQLRDAMAGQPSEKFAAHSKTLRDWRWVTLSGKALSEISGLEALEDVMARDYLAVMTEQLNAPSIFQQFLPPPEEKPRDVDWAPE